MNKSAMLCALLAGLGGVGCASKYADVPTPTRFYAAQQNKIQAAQHWQVIANHVSETRGITAGPEHVCVITLQWPQIDTPVAQRSG